MTTLKITNFSSVSMYAGNSAVANSIDGVIEKHWNRKVKKALLNMGRSPNQEYAEKYSSTLERLKAKLDAKTKKN
jgi:hypothetical protein